MVYLLHGEGHDTGIDLAALVDTAWFIADALGSRRPPSARHRRKNAPPGWNDNKPPPVHGLARGENIRRKHDPRHAHLEPLPGRLAGAHLTAFTKLAELSYDRKLNGYAELWRASVADPARFWSLVWDYCGVIGDKGRHRAE